MWHRISLSQSCHPMAPPMQIEDKSVQWLGAGVRLVWVLYPETQRLQVHWADGTVTKLPSGAQRAGEGVVPGFLMSGRRGVAGAITTDAQ